MDLTLSKKLNFTLSLAVKRFCRISLGKKCPEMEDPSGALAMLSASSTHHGVESWWAQGPVAQLHQASGLDTTELPVWLGELYPWNPLFASNMAADTAVA